MVLIFDYPSDGDGDRTKIAVTMPGVPPVGSIVKLPGSKRTYEIARYGVDVTGNAREYNGRLVAVLVEHQAGPVTLDA